MGFEMNSFVVNEVELNYSTDIDSGEPLRVRSMPRPYTVSFSSGLGVGARLAEEICNSKMPLLLIDEWIYINYFAKEDALKNIPTFILKAVEENKGIDTVLRLIDFFESNNASKASMLFAIGGGIIQDVAAFSAYMYKRGIPWTFVPTTLLAQGDSSVGGKTALNHKKTKNLLALFSAPRKIITDTGFLETLADSDWLSGGGEIVRLCITGGEASLQALESGIEGFLDKNLEVTTKLIRMALSVKRAVVEYDEFELDIRRSMNYGHSFGHALEVLTNYEIVHGIGVALGILVENEISFKRGVLKPESRDRIMRLINKIISEPVWYTFKNANMDGILELLKRDKKAEGPVLKVATLNQVGRIDFINLKLDEGGEKEVREAFLSVVKNLEAIR
jgi:3-dehydroquinate synthase